MTEIGEPTWKRGLLLGGGTGSRFWPSTAGTSKHLFPVLDKPLIYYPLAAMMLAGVRDVTLVCTPRDREAYVGLLGQGDKWGMRIRYQEQQEPLGIVDALTQASEFLSDRPFALFLGDNILHGSHIGGMLEKSWCQTGGAVFGVRVSDVQEYGAAVLDEDGVLARIEEKPARGGAGYAVPGAYFYGEDLFDFVDALSTEPSQTSISDVNESLRKAGRLTFGPLPRGTFWSDAGSPTRLLDSASYVAQMQHRTGSLIGSPEEVALRNNWITWSELERLVASMPVAEYRDGLLRLFAR